MTYRILWATAVLALLGTSLSAQDTGLSLGETVTDDPAIGQRYTGEKFDDWTLRCIKTDQETDPCEMFQVLKDQEDNTVAEMALNKFPGDGPAVAGGVLVTPLETLLTKQVTIVLGDGQGRRYPFSVCTAVGCIARLGLTAEDIAAYKAGSEAQVIIYPFAAPDTPVILPMSLAGFTAAYGKI